jgi:predicted DNA-binding antitoxin AbrB/MazE fold protein
MRLIEARYEEGLLKPEKPLALTPGERVAAHIPSVLKLRDVPGTVPEPSRSVRIVSRRGAEPFRSVLGVRGDFREPFRSVLDVYGDFGEPSKSVLDVYGDSQEPSKSVLDVL